MPPRRVVATSLAAVFLTAMMTMAGGMPTVAQSTPSASVSLPSCLPPGTSLPAGVSLPPGVTIPVCRSSSAGPSMQALVRQFVSQGSLPTGLSRQEVVALLKAPSGQLPPQLANLSKALRHLAGINLNGPLVADIVCSLNSPAKGGAIFPDLGSVPWAKGDIGALSAAGILRGVLPSSDSGGFEPDNGLTQGDWLALIMRAVGALPTNGGTGGPTSSAAAMQAAKAAGLFPPGGGIAPDANASVDIGQAVTFLVRAVGLSEVARQAATGAPNTELAANTPTWARGAMALSYQLGLLSNVGVSSTKPLTRADAAALLTRALGLLATTVDALNKPTITAIDPTPLGPGLRATVSGQYLGQKAGTVKWQPTGGPSQRLQVSAWTAQQVTVQVPADARAGWGSLSVTTSSGEKISAPVQVLAPIFRIGKSMPNGMVALLVNSRTFYVPKADGAALMAMAPSRQIQWFRQASLELGVGSSPAVHVRRAPALRVNTVSSSLAEGQNGRPPVRRSSAMCTQGCQTLYGPQAMPYSRALSAARVNYDVPCATIMGYKVCSGWATAGVDLGGMVSGFGSPTGYFTQVGSALSGASLVTAASMSATLGLTYTPKRAGDLVVVEAKVITNQVDGGVGVAGAGTAPIYAYASSSGYGKQEAVIASPLDTMSASVAAWPDLSAVDLADQALTKLDGINDTAQTLWQLTGLPGERGTAHVANFSWSGTALPGQSIDVSLNTQAIAASNGLSQTEVNAVSGVVLVKVIEYPPPAQSTASPSACVNPPGVSGKLDIHSVFPRSAVTGSQFTIQGSGFGRDGQIALYNPDLGVVTDAVVQTWESGKVTAQVPDAPAGPSKLFVFPTPYSCSPEKPVRFDILPPQVTASRLSFGYAQPVLKVTGQGFGPGPSVGPSLANNASGAFLTDTVSLHLMSAAGGAGVPPVPFTVNATDYVTNWSDTGFTLPFDTGRLGLFSHLQPGTYRVTLTQTFSNHGHTLKEVYPPDTSPSINFVGASGWPRQSVKEVRRLGLVKLPATVLASVASPAGGNEVGPGGTVVIDGSGFGNSPGTIILSPQVSATLLPYAIPNPLGSHVVGAANIDAWSDGRVAFVLPAGLRPGLYAVWVLHTGWGPWSDQPGPLMISVSALTGSCLIGQG